jgi:hypothetical protein
MTPDQDRARVIERARIRAFGADSRPEEAPFAPPRLA